MRLASYASRSEADGTAHRYRKGEAKTIRLTFRRSCSLATGCWASAGGERMGEDQAEVGVGGWLGIGKLVGCRGYLLFK